ncbi:hypothetical protein CRUP_002909 [Coryphaenoides rupestris]|nr:hypothetical protein CRUP_002909 [Coryphaenoides rupestris]
MRSGTRGRSASSKCFTDVSSRPRESANRHCLRTRGASNAGNLQLALSVRVGRDLHLRRRLGLVAGLMRRRISLPRGLSSTHGAVDGLAGAVHNPVEILSVLECGIGRRRRQATKELHQLGCGHRLFSDFITVEMLFHSKALEVYTHTLQNLETIDIQQDLELFNARIRVSDALSGPLDPVLLTSRSASSMSAASSPTRQARPAAGGATAAAAQSLSPSLASAGNYSLFASGRGPSLSSTTTRQASRSGRSHRQPRQDRSPTPARRLFPGKLQRQKGIEEEEEEDDEEEEEEEEAEEEEDDEDIPKVSVQNSYQATRD